MTTATATDLYDARSSAVNALLSVFGAMFETDTVELDGPGEVCRRVEGIIASIDFSGTRAINLSLCLPKSTSVELTERFLGEAMPFEDENVADAMAELLNIIAGDFVANLAKSDVTVQMGLPSVIRGFLEVLDLSGVSQSAVTMCTGEYPFELRVSVAHGSDTP